MRRVFYASSSEVYGDPEVFPTPESYEGKVDPLGPRSCYEEWKRWKRRMVRLAVVVMLWRRTDSLLWPLGARGR